MGSMTRRFDGGNHTGACVRLVYEPETKTVSGSWPITSATPPSLGVCPVTDPRSAPKRFDTSWRVAFPEGLPAALSDSASGRELIDLGYADDVAIAAEVPQRECPAAPRASVPGRLEPLTIRLGAAASSMGGFLREANARCCIYMSVFDPRP